MLTVGEVGAGIELLGLEGGVYFWLGSARCFAFAAPLLLVSERPTMIGDTCRAPKSGIDFLEGLVSARRLQPFLKKVGFGLNLWSSEYEC